MMEYVSWSTFKKSNKILQNIQDIQVKLKILKEKELYSFEETYLL